ncbi:MAG: hypothetical protein V1787_02155 [Candidatus Micrarchaeota archaeon]
MASSKVVASLVALAAIASVLMMGCVQEGNDGPGGGQFNGNPQDGQQPQGFRNGTGPRGFGNGTGPRNMTIEMCNSVGTVVPASSECPEGQMKTPALSDDQQSACCVDRSRFPGNFTGNRSDRPPGNYSGGFRNRSGYPGAQGSGSPASGYPG